ncbi:hypothetical protein FSP39_018021 [Pinctada imbricata]|uniref:Uncharacterized protein n=1 Tax=Pinctada imbricata TaxID=66713 RepID=A0AA89CB11_PINIB|nr:hypothetical protein FSP39_018021 [Pinctada imbricata]
MEVKLMSARVGNKNPGSGTRPSAGIRDHLTIAPAKRYTRKGRKINKPSRIIEVIKMVVKCHECSAEYANNRNIKRHHNAVYNNNVKYVLCEEKIQGSDTTYWRFFYRREYLAIHFEAVHHFNRDNAKVAAGKVKFSYTDRKNIEVSGPNEKRLRLDTTERNIDVDSSEKRPIQGPCLSGALDHEDTEGFARGPSPPGASGEEP